MNWEDLRALREGGRRPHRLVVTTNWRYAAEHAADGAMVIVHAKGEPMPVELLDGLDVELRLENCEQACGVARLVKSREVIPSCVRTWCRCDDVTDTMWPHNCKAKAEMDAAWEVLCNRAA